MVGANRNRNFSCLLGILGAGFFSSTLMASGPIPATAPLPSPVQTPTVQLMPTLPPLPPEVIRAQAQEKVFQLLTEVTGGHEKESYGTAFVIRQDGWMISNFHVVSNAMIYPKNYGLFLKVGTEKLPAKVKAIDLVNDLALIKVERNFSSAYTFADHLPAPGEKIYSAGLPEDTVMQLIEGLYSDSIQFAGLNRSFVSAPLNHGMSGGPSLNAFGQLVGVNDAMVHKAQNISILIPVAVVSTLAQKIGAERAPASLQTNDEIKSQIHAAYHSWIEQWTQSLTTGPSMTVGKYAIYGKPQGLKCWEESEKLPISDSKKIHINLCRSPEVFPLYGNRHGGEIEFSYFKIESEKGAKEETSGSTWNQFKEQNTTNLLKQGIASKKFREDEDSRRSVCSHRFVMNKKQVKMLVEYCATQLKEIKGVFDLTVSATPTMDSAPVVAIMSLSGLTREEIIPASNTFIESIGEDGR